MKAEDLVKGESYVYKNQVLLKYLGRIQGAGSAIQLFKGWGQYYTMDDTEMGKIRPVDTGRCYCGKCRECGFC